MFLMGVVTKARTTRVRMITEMYMYSLASTKKRDTFIVGGAQRILVTDIILKKE